MKHFGQTTVGFLLLLTTLSVSSVRAQEAPSVTFTAEDTWKSLSLEAWRFSLGDDLRWADPDFDDSGWRLLTSRTNYDTAQSDRLGGDWVVANPIRG